MVTVTLIAVGMLVLTRAHLIFPIQLLGEHLFFVPSPTPPPAAGTSRVVLVAITEEDYLCPSLFDGKSPLRRDLIYQLINKVASAYDPRDPVNAPRIVVDIDLSGSWEPPAAYKPPNDLSCSNGKFIKPSILKPLKVNRDKITVVEPTLMTMDSNHKEVPVLADPTFRVEVAGGEEAMKAVSLFPYDWDHRARTYIREVDVRRGPHGADLTQCKTLPALSLVGTLDESVYNKEWVPCKPKEAERRFLSFSTSKIATYTSGEVLTEDNISFAGKTVVIGGMFLAGRDSYSTPAGSLSGMQLVALSIDAESRHTGIGEPKEVAKFTADLVMGAILVLLSLSFDEGLGLTLAIVAAITLPLASSLLLFRTVNLFLNFVPLIMGAMAHVAYDRHSELKKQVNECKKDCGTYQGKNDHLEKLVHRLKRRNRSLKRKNAELLGKLGRPNIILENVILRDDNNY